MTSFEFFANIVSFSDGFVPEYSRMAAPKTPQFPPESAGIVGQHAI
jgi:hypothetical protein